MHPGEIVAGKYRVAKVLGRSRGALLEANHTEFDQRVVIRMMSPALCDEKQLEQFRREARTLSKLESEHVGRIIDLGTHSDGSFFLVRQYLEGIDLATHIKNQGALRLDEAVLYVLQAAEAVEECHTNHIILRELQPSSLFLTTRRGGSPMVKVIDFGTAKVLKDPAGQVIDGEMTATVMFGLSPYSSPELLRKTKNVDMRTDVWSMGCVLYELLAAVPPFQGEMAELMLKITRDDPLPLTSLRPDLPKDFDQITGWSLAKDPSARFSSIYAFAHALKPYASAEGQVLIDRIGRIHHAGPDDTATAAKISPTSPLAKNRAHQLAALGDDDDSATVIRSAPSDDESDLEKTAFIGDVNEVFAGRRPSVAPPVGPSTAAATGTGNFAALDGLPATNGTGGYPAMSSTAAVQATKRQRKLAVVAIGAALVVLPVLVMVLFFALGDGQAETTLAGTDGAESGDAVQPSTAAGGDETTNDVATGGSSPTAGAGGGNTAAPADDNSSASGYTRPPTTTTSSGSGGPGPDATASTTVTSTPPDDDDVPPPPPDDDDAPPPPTPTKGKLVALAIGGTCSFSVDGAGKGSGSSIQVEVALGRHTVSCRYKGSTRMQSVNVTSSRPGIAKFKLN